MARPRAELLVTAKTQDCDCHSDDDHVMTTGNTGGNIQSIVSDYLQLGN